MDLLDRSIDRGDSGGAEQLERRPIGQAKGSGQTTVNSSEARPITHFEVYGGDPAKLAEFYRAVLGWWIEKAPGVDYWRIPVGQANSEGLSGGITYRPEKGPDGWLCYVRVPSVDAAIEEACRLGGALVRAKTAVPKAAWHAMLADPEGNVFSVWQPDPAAFPELEPE